MQSAGRQRQMKGPEDVLRQPMDFEGWPTAQATQTFKMGKNKILQSLNKSKIKPPVVHFACQPIHRARNLPAWTIDQNSFFKLHVLQIPNIIFLEVIFVFYKSPSGSAKGSLCPPQPPRSHACAALGVFLSGGAETQRRAIGEAGDPRAVEAQGSLVEVAQPPKKTGNRRKPALVEEKNEDSAVVFKGFVWKAIWQISAQNSRLSQTLLILLKAIWMSKRERSEAKNTKVSKNKWSDKKYVANQFLGGFYQPWQKEWPQDCQAMNI